MRKRKISELESALERIDEELREVDDLLSELSTTSSLTATSFESIKERVRRLLAYDPVTGTLDQHTYSMISLATASVDEIRNKLYEIRDSLIRRQSELALGRIASRGILDWPRIRDLLIRRGTLDWLLHGDEYEDEEEY